MVLSCSLIHKKPFRFKSNVLLFLSPPPRSNIKSLQANLAALQSLRGRVLVRSKSEKAFELHLKELSNMIEALDKFLNECHISVAQTASVSPADDDQVHKHTAVVDRLITAGEHHTTGSASAKKRFTAML